MPARVVVATPVAPPDTVASLQDDADEVIALHTPQQFFAIGQFYEDFAQTPDDEVVRLLAASREAVVASAARAGDAGDPPGRDEEVEVHVGAATVGGHLTVPDGARAIVVFAHGSGSSRHSSRNRFVASVLNRAGLGTLLFDLLTPAEEHDRANVFDIPLLARRLVDVTRWLRTQPEGRDAAIGYFGASTGAGAALWAAAESDADVRAVVSRGGRPDLAAPRLGDVRAPTLLIVGGDDTLVLQLNREAQAADAVRDAPECRAGCLASLRGAGHAADGGRARTRLVRRPLDGRGPSRRVTRDDGLSSRAGVARQDGQHVARGNDADDRPVVDDGDVPDSFCRHLFRDREDRLVGFGEHDVVAHDVGGPHLIRIAAVGERAYDIAFRDHADRAVGCRTSATPISSSASTAASERSVSFSSTETAPRDITSLTGLLGSAIAWVLLSSSA